MTEVLGIDVGGSGIKAALVDVQAGQLVTERFRVPTPQPATPSNMSSSVRELMTNFDYSGPIGCCFPSVIIKGVAFTAGNISEDWIGTSVEDEFAKATGQRVVALNDADAAGVAEMGLGAGRELDGMVLTLTIGTGIGSALYYNGVLVPNTEIGHMLGPDGKPIEQYAGDRARKLNELDWPEWGERFQVFLQRTIRVLTPDHIILGGGVSKKWDRFSEYVDVRVPIHIAEHRNNAGIIGAALEAQRLA